MNHLKKLTSSAQATSEMIIAVPLLLLLAAGAIQFSLIFQAKVQFDHACGEAARQYAAGLLRTDYAFKSVIWANLNPRQNYFIRDSIDVSVAKTSAYRDKLLSGSGQFLKPVTKSVMDYDGEKWTVIIRSNPPPFFGLIFPKGVPFSSTLAVLRHPSIGI
jgi:hypothetical protein